VSTDSSYPQDGATGRLDFQALVDQHYAPLYRFAMSLTGTESDAGDLVQETFLAWAAKGHQLHDLSKVKAWLFTTLHRFFLESRRRSTRFPHLDIDTADRELPNVDPVAVDRLDAQSVVDLLTRVDAQYRAAVALFYLQDYSYNEIGDILAIPLGTVKSRIARGLTQLKKLVQQPSPGGRQDNR
jgi:RNA polymerase sigma-70 factor (ECF subfamily)